MLKDRIIENIRNKDTKELTRDHVTEISFDEKEATVLALIDKRYAIHLFTSHAHAEAFVSAVKKTFGENVATVFRMAHPHHAHDREMLVPHAVHFG